MPIPFRQDRSPVEKPGPSSRTCRAWMPGKRQAGWPSLWVTFLLASKRKVTRPPQEDETLCKRNSRWQQRRGKTKGLGPCIRSGDEESAIPRTPTPHLNPLPKGRGSERKKQEASLELASIRILTPALSQRERGQSASLPPRQNQHRIAIRKEAIALLDRVAIRVKHELASR